MGRRPAGGPEISIHALREEGDQWSAAVVGWLRDFYPRPPRGGRPGARTDRFAEKGISIHALREEGDRPPPGQAQHKATNFYPRPPRGGRPSRCLPPVIPRHFYPRPPRGGRQSYRCRCRERRGFLSTPSARRATGQDHRRSLYPDISIHALREEGDDQTAHRTRQAV